MACGKRYWPHRHAAQAAARALKQTAYECPDCDGWHLTTQSETVRRAYEDRERQRTQEAQTMGVKINLRVLQANPATASEITNTDKEGNVTGIERVIYEDVVLGVTAVSTGSQDGGGRHVTGQLVIAVPEGDLKVGQQFEAELSEIDPAAAPAPAASEGNTLRQDPAEAERGRLPDGTVPEEGSSASSGSKSSRSRSKSK